MNLTISVDQEIVHRARARATAERTSVNALLRELLKDYAEVSNRYAEATAALLAISDEADSGSGPEGRTWTREEIYDRPVFRQR